MKADKRKLVHEDSRGFIYDLIVGELISAVGLVTFNKGAIRGNHIHFETAQWNYILAGNLNVVTEKEGMRNEQIFETGELFLIPPGEAHAMQANSNTEMLVLTLGPRAGKDFEKDTQRLAIPLINSKFE
jgi:quercetin dioxygenase-like cupin family protein